MLKTSKKILSTIMVVIMVLTAVPLSSFVGIELPAFDLGIRASAKTVASSGYCGPNVTYTYNSSTGELVISGEGPMTDYEYSDGSPFYYSSIKSLVIGDGVTTIGNHAFSGCTNLTSITIPDSVTTIGNYAFSGCTNLTSITIPDGVKTIGDYAFSECAYLETINIPDSVIYIGADILKNTAWFNYRGKGLITLDNWIYGYKGADSDIVIEIDDDAKSVVSNAFRNVDVLEFKVSSSNPYLTTSDGVLFNKEKTILYAYPLSKTDSSYIIPDSVVEINSSAFYNCDNLYNITMGKNVKTIGASAFYSSKKSGNRNIYITDLEAWCEIDFANVESNPMYSRHSSYVSYFYIDGVEATNIIIPDTITEIKAYTFYNCYSIKSIIIPDSVTLIDKYAFYNCYNLTNVTIGNSVTSIGEYAFYNCNRLTNISFPDTVEIIGYFAFGSCYNLTNITLGKNLRSIATYAFEFCSNLKDIFYPGSQKDWEAISIGADDEGYFNNACLYLMHTHEYTKTMIKEPSCTSDGEILYTCIHGDTITEIISTSGHNWVDMGGSIEATCTTDGVNNYKCSNCGEEKKGTITATGHDWDTIKEIPATCYETGYISRVCMVPECGFKEEKELPENHYWMWDVNKEPTCTDEGENKKWCMECNMVSERKSIPAKGHTYSAWVELLPATCSERGLNIKICNDCNDIQRQIIPKLAHIDADGNGVCDTCENTDTPDVPDTPDEPDTPDVPDTPNEPDVPEDPSANCSCNCHKSGLSKILFNIILFFQKFLRMNKTCTCGASHY